MKKSILFFGVIAMLLTGCSINNNSNSKLQKDIISCFDKQMFLDNNINDDSSFCGHYYPRLIEYESYFFNYFTKVKDNAYAFQLTINGHEKGLIPEWSINSDGEVTFNDESFDVLSVHIYKNQEIYNLKEAHESGMIDVGVLKNLNDEAKRKEPDIKYYESLPLLVNGEKSLPKIDDYYENIKRQLYQQEFVDKGILNTFDYEPLKDRPVDQNRRITIDSLFLQDLYGSYDDVVIFGASVNGIGKVGWSTANSYYPVGSSKIICKSYLEPFVWNDNKVYSLSKAYEIGVIDDAFIEKYKYDDYAFNDYLNIEPLETMWNLYILSLPE